ncbi:hypothetical protein JHK87_022697 [Glycine soja]|nr:hypothetical protein JHK87_022697 [Glycine soja]
MVSTRSGLRHETPFEGSNPPPTTMMDTNTLQQLENNIADMKCCHEKKLRKLKPDHNQLEAHVRCPQHYWALKDKIEELIEARYLVQFVKRPDNHVAGARLGGHQEDWHRNHDADKRRDKAKDLGRQRHHQQRRDQQPLQERENEPTQSALNEFCFSKGLSNPRSALDESHFSKGSSNPRSALGESHFSKGSSNPRSTLGECHFSKGLLNPRSTLGEPRRSSTGLSNPRLGLVSLAKAQGKQIPGSKLVKSKENKSTRTLQTEGLPRGAKIQGPPLVRTPTIPKACPWSAHSLRTTMTTVKGLSSKSLNKLPSDWSIRPSTRWKSY